MVLPWQQMTSMMQIFPTGKASHPLLLPTWLYYTILSVDQYEDGNIGDFSRYFGSKFDNTRLRSE